MKLLIKVQSGGEGVQEDIKYLKYHLNGRPDEQYNDCNIEPLNIRSFEILKKEPLIVIVDCNADEYNIFEYLGTILDITYDILD